MIEIDKNEVAYMRENKVFVSMTNRGKRSTAKTYYLTESARNIKLHERYLNGRSK